MLAQRRRSAYYRLFAADGVLRHLVREGEQVLDAGCSDGRGSELLGPLGATGVDIYRPSLVEAARAHRRRPVVQADVRRLPFRAESFDVVVSLDVVEHFTKPDAVRLISELERVARRLVVVLTPCGFVSQPPGEDEPWQEHKCGFEAGELEALGYSVSGLGGPKALRGPYGRFRLGALGQLAAVVSGPVTRRRPEHAFHLVAVRDLGRTGR